MRTGLGLSICLLSPMAHWRSGWRQRSEDWSGSQRRSPLFRRLGSRSGSWRSQSHSFSN